MEVQSVISYEEMVRIKYGFTNKQWWGDNEFRESFLKKVREWEDEEMNEMFKKEV